MFTHQSPAMPSRYSRPSASTTVESLPETMTSCCCSSCLWGTIGWMTLSRSCRTTAGRSGAFDMGVSCLPALAGGALALEAGPRQAERQDGRGRRGRDAGGVERGLVGSAEALAGELDQVVAHHHGLDQLLELAAAQGLAGRPPEGTAGGAAALQTPGQ